MIAFRNIIFSLLLLALANNDSIAQTINYSVHANIIYRFTKYIDWPDDNKSGDFVIGIIGDSPIYDELKKTTAGKTIGNQKITVVKILSTQNIYNCHILFISDYERSYLKKVVTAKPNSSFLIVTEESGLCLKGACINIYEEDEKMIMEINKKNIEKRGLHVAGELLALAKIVE